MSTPAPIMDFLHRLYRLQTVQELSETICDGLTDLVDGENVILCRHDGSRKIITSVVARHPFSRADMMPYINMSGIMAQHPFWETTFLKNTPVRALSDQVSKNVWQRNPLYHEVFQPDGIEDQINMEVEGDPLQFTTINVLRDRRGFSQKDRNLLRQLHPHFTQALQNARLAERNGLFPDASGAWVVQVDARGRVRADHEEDRRNIAIRFATRGDFPDAVRAWIRAGVASLNSGLRSSRLRPYSLRSGGGDWTFTLHRDLDRDHYLLFVRRTSTEVSTEDLTPREAEVLHWVGQGKTNQDISSILGIGVETVKTHLKRVYQKLGVENRTAAVAAFRQKTP